MGPFYCPIDQKVYLDTSFFQDLERRFGACNVGSKTCQFSQAYVIASIGPVGDGFLAVNPEAFPTDFAADAPKSVARR
jgi:hypothetical protein